MGLGLKIGDDNLIELGQIKEELIHNLNKTNIRYKIMFEKVDKNTNIKETIMSIPDLDIEISLENDYINYIKAKASEYNTLINNIKYVKSDLDKVNKLISAIKLYFNIGEVQVSSLDMSNLELIVVIKDEYYNYKVHIMTNQKGQSFISNMKVI